MNSHTIRDNVKYLNDRRIFALVVAVLAAIAWVMFTNPALAAFITQLVFFLPAAAGAMFLLFSVVREFVVTNGKVNWKSSSFGFETPFKYEEVTNVRVSDDTERER